MSFFNMDISENKKIYVKETSNKGSSLFAWCNIQKDEIITLFCWIITNQASIYTIPISQTLFIDPTPFDGYGKYLCHSCSPNAGIKGRNLLVAMQNIMKDEEINIDYAMIVNEFYPWSPWSEITCNCGSENCRWKFFGYQELDSDSKIRYSGYISEYLLEV